MNSREFCYWLQGCFEIGLADGSKSIAPDKVRLIRKNLESVFREEIDPSAGPADHQQVLNEIHSGASAEEVQRLKEKLEVLEKQMNWPSHDPLSTNLRC